MHDSVPQSIIGQDGNTGQSSEVRWSRWHKREQALRVFHCAWILDAMWRYHFNEASIISPQRNDAPLPCHEDFWQAPSAEIWDGVNASYTYTSNLGDVLQQVFVGKSLNPHVGEFARVVIIHGILQRSNEVERYWGDPLSHWQPSAGRDNVKEILPRPPIWLPSIQTFTK